MEKLTALDKINSILLPPIKNQKNSGNLWQKMGSKHEFENFWRERLLIKSINYERKKLIDEKGSGNILGHLN